LKVEAGLRWRLAVPIVEGDHALSGLVELRLGLAAVTAAGSPTDKNRPDRSDPNVRVDFLALKVRPPSAVLARQWTRIDLIVRIRTFGSIFWR